MVVVAGDAVEIVEIAATGVVAVEVVAEDDEVRASAMATVGAMTLELSTSTTRVHSHPWVKVRFTERATPYRFKNWASPISYHHDCVFMLSLSYTCPILVLPSFYGH